MAYFFYVGGGPGGRSSQVGRGGGKPNATSMLFFPLPPGRVDPLIRYLLHQGHGHDKHRGGA